MSGNSIDGRTRRGLDSESSDQSDVQLNRTSNNSLRSVARRSTQQSSLEPGHALSRSRNILTCRIPRAHPSCTYLYGQQRERSACRRGRRADLREQCPPSRSKVQRRHGRVSDSAGIRIDQVTRREHRTMSRPWNAQASRTFPEPESEEAIAGRSIGAVRVFVFTPTRLHSQDDLMGLGSFLCDF